MSEVEINEIESEETPEIEVEVSEVEKYQSELTTVSTNLETAKSLLADVQSAFAAGKAPDGVSFETMMALPGDVTRLSIRVSQLETLISGAKRQAGEVAVNQLVNPIHDIIRVALVTAGVFNAMEQYGLGGVVTFTASASSGDDAPIAINHRFSARPSAPVVAAASGDATPASSSGRRGRMVITDSDGKTYSSKEYIFAYFTAGKAAGYNSSRADATQVPAVEYAKISPVIASKLGHVVSYA